MNRFCFATAIMALSVGLLSRAPAAAADVDPNKLIGTWMKVAVVTGQDSKLTFAKDGRFHILNKLSARVTRIDGTYTVKGNQLTMVGKDSDGKAYEQSDNIKLTNKLLDLKDKGGKTVEYYKFRKLTALESKLKPLSASEWVIIKIDQTGIKNMDLYVRNVHQPHGVWCKPGDWSTVWKNNDIEGLKCPADQITQIWARGIKGVAVGTEGSFDLYDGPPKSPTNPNEPTKIGTFSYDSPWSGDNTGTFLPSSKAYVIMCDAPNAGGSGALGVVTLTVVKKSAGKKK